MVQPNTKNRLLSLDIMRGLIMVLLMFESVNLYNNLLTVVTGTPLEFLVTQFFHHPWNGLRLWDVIQPGFMFMAGTAMAYSLHRQQMEGMPWTQSLYKVLKRSGWLFFFGVLDYAVHTDGLSFELWDVLTQLSFTTLVAFLIFRWSFTNQIFFSIGLLLITELLYRFTNIPGFDQPFTNQHNFGNYVDLLLMNKINEGGWVAINCIPTSAHTIWGVLVGKLLLSDKTEKEKIKWLFISGITALVIGYALDSTITPIIKKIATSSFTIVSGGWCLLLLALFYWWIDIKNHKINSQFFIIIGMNSLFIYLFIEIPGSRWFNGYIETISNSILAIINVPHPVAAIITSLIIFLLEWILCLFLYRRSIFLKV